MNRLFSINNLLNISVYRIPRLYCRTRRLKFSQYCDSDIDDILIDVTKIKRGDALFFVENIPRTSRLSSSTYREIINQRCSETLARAKNIDIIILSVHLESFEVIYGRFTEWFKGLSQMPSNGQFISYF